jgi:hypothetical protein
MRQDSLGESRGPRAVLNAIERLGRGYGIECERTQEDLGIAETQLQDSQARVGLPFPHAEYLSQVTGSRDGLKAGLAAAEPKEGEPMVANLAERIKALRAANSVDATSERTSARRVSAEGPVTAEDTAESRGARDRSRGGGDGALRNGSGASVRQF